MPKDSEILVEQCWRQLRELHRSAAELKRACAANENILARTAGALSPSAGVRSAFTERDFRSWRQKAEETRELANRMTVAQAKPKLLEIADVYGRLQD